MVSPTQTMTETFPIESKADQEAFSFLKDGIRSVRITGSLLHFTSRLKSNSFSIISFRVHERMKHERSMQLKKKESAIGSTSTSGEVRGMLSSFDSPQPLCPSPPFQTSQVHTCQPNSPAGAVMHRASLKTVTHGSDLFNLKDSDPEGCKDSCRFKSDSLFTADR